MVHGIKVAAVAVASLDGMVEQNYQRALRLGEISLEKKPNIILYPEAFAAGYCSDDLLPYAEEKDSKYLEGFRALSEKGSCMVLVGYIEKSGGGIKNAVDVFDQGKLLGVHYKSSLWPDKKRPYRDEISLMMPGDGIDVFKTRFGNMSVLICYENDIPENWRVIQGRADFVLSPYNCECDPTQKNVNGAKIAGIPSAWANRTGTVWKGDGFMPNVGTAGMVDKEGRLLQSSSPGVEDIVFGELRW